MLSKKLLASVLGVGVIFGTSSGMLAMDGVVSCAPSTSRVDTDVVANVGDMLAIAACREYLLVALSEKLGILPVAVFCCQLKYSMDIQRLKAEFERLYEDEPEFKKAVDAAWVTDSKTGVARHASTPGRINKRSSKAN